MFGTTAAVIYALSPGQANDQPIDYNTTWVQKHHADATKKLTDKPYEGGPQNLKMFLERLNSRAEESGWSEITKINNPIWDNHYQRYEWKKVVPKDLQDIKQKNGKKYHWHIKHQMWTLHKPEDCKLEGKEAPKDDKLNLMAALVVNEDDEDSVE